MDYAIVFGVLAGLLVLKLVVRRVFWRRHRRSRVRWLARRLDASPEQEELMREELNSLRSAFWDARGEWRASRDDLQAVLGAESFDKERVTSTFRRQDELLGALRMQMLQSAERVHAGLRPEQRQKLARLFARRGGCHRPHHA